MQLEQIRKYSLYLVEQPRVSASYQNQAVNAIRLWFEGVLGQTLDPVVIPRPKREKSCLMCSVKKKWP